MPDCYISKNASGSMYCFSLKRPALEELKGLKSEDLLNHCQRINRCIFHSKQTGEDEALVWTFKNGSMLNEQQAVVLHNFLDGNDEIQEVFAKTDQKSLIIKTIYNAEILVVLACKHSKFHTAPSRTVTVVPRRHTLPAGMRSVLSELEASFTSNDQEESASGIVNLVTPGSSACGGGRPSGESEFTFESVGTEDVNGQSYI
ncbi:hypothetical protein SEMRO_773_G200440.1 [Seminavis robusta]|uniref:Uncharacterized protein n=1 Tax=Seminavis robusta TaxID=568900 RepID=A0A9N8HKR4_9STRA|nr:hypothetical protein SEMRO_773_G200440.1 [Seminavis robusta]|eukprot:Sro773_g200440.1 n/a (202) ;mRNA; f:23298-23903